MNKMMDKSLLSKKENTTIVIGFLGIFLSLFGLLAIRNAMLHLSFGQDFVCRQSFWFLLGLLLFCSLVKWGTIKRLEKLLKGATIFTGILLWSVLLLGTPLQGQYKMTGWFNWGDIFFQPAELAKPIFAFMIVQCCCFARDRKQIWKTFFLPLAFFLLWVFPIVLQPDFGCVLVLSCTFLLVYFLAKNPLKPLIFFTFPILACGVLVALWRYPHLWKRIEGFISPFTQATGTGWHLLQFQNTLANGGWWGKTVLPDCWHNAFLPLGYSDSIFATIAETGGFFSALGLILLPIFWSFYFYKNSESITNHKNQLVIMSMGGYLTIQAMIHISVNLGMMPTTGLTYPLISYGGSSMLTTWFTLAICAVYMRESDREDHIPIS